MLLAHGSIAIPRPINGAEDFDRLMEIWSAVAPQLLPSYADDHEPIRRPFDLSRREENLRLWRSTTMWLARRARPSVKLSVHGALGRTNSTIHLTVPGPDAPASVDKLSRLVLALASAFEADYAGVHTLCQREVEEARAVRRPDVYTINRNTGLAAMGFGFSIPMARDGLATIYWANFLGPRLQAFFGEGLIVGAGWERLDRGATGLIGWVTDVPPDDGTWEPYRDGRNVVIDSLGRDAFFPDATRTPDLGPDGLISGDIYRR